MEYLVIGEILKPQGIRGELKLKPITCDPERFYELEYVFFKRGEEYVQCGVNGCRVAQDTVYMSIEGVEDRERAEKLRGELLYIDREHAVKLPEDANFICDLIGLKGEDSDGNALGELSDVLQPGGNDVYVFQGARGQVLVPALKSVVLEVDIAAGRMLLNAQRLKEVAVFDDD